MMALIERVGGEKCVCRGGKKKWVEMSPWKRDEPRYEFDYTKIKWILHKVHRRLIFFSLGY